MDTTTRGSQAVKIFLATGFNRKPVNALRNKNSLHNSGQRDSEREEVCSSPLSKQKQNPNETAGLPPFGWEPRDHIQANLGQQLRAGWKQPRARPQRRWSGVQEPTLLGDITTRESMGQELCKWDIFTVEKCPPSSRSWQSWWRKGQWTTSQAQFCLHRRPQCLRACFMQSRCQHSIRLPLNTLLSLHGSDMLVGMANWKPHCASFTTCSLLLI